MNTTIVNLYGGPGTGKSTAAAYLYYRLKTLGKNAELVREYVKEWAWEGRNIGSYDQLYFLGKQLRKETLLYGKTEYIVTDCPVLMGSYYAQRYAPENIASGVRIAARTMYQQAEKDGHRHIHVMLQRSKPYKAEGRYQTEAEAKGIDAHLVDLLTSEYLTVGSFIECATDEQDLDWLLKHRILDENG